MKSDIHTKAIQVNYHFPGILTHFWKGLLELLLPPPPDHIYNSYLWPQSQGGCLKVASLQSCPRVTQIIISVSPTLPHCLSALVGVTSHWAVSLPPWGYSPLSRLLPLCEHTSGQHKPHTVQPFLTHSTITQEPTSGYVTHYQRAGITKGNYNK